jgi:hypothetical protein
VPTVGTHLRRGLASLRRRLDGGPVHGSSLRSAGPATSATDGEGTDG